MMRTPQPGDKKGGRMNERAGPSASDMNRTVTIRRSLGVNESPVSSPQEGKKEKSVVAEAKACLLRAKHHLGASRNTKREIVSEVTAAVERLYQLVKEATLPPKRAEAGAERCCKSTQTWQSARVDAGTQAWSATRTEAGTQAGSAVGKSTGTQTATGEGTSTQPLDQGVAGLNTSSSDKPECESCLFLSEVANGLRDTARDYKRKYDECKEKLDEHRRSQTDTKEAEIQCAAIGCCAGTQTESTSGRSVGTQCESAAGTDTKPATRMASVRAVGGANRRHVGTQSEADGTVKESRRGKSVTYIPETLFERLKVNESLLIESKERIERLNVLLENTSKTLSESSSVGQTYASVASVTPRKRFPGVTALHSVLVSSSNEAETCEKVMDRIRSAIDAKEGWVKVERVRKVKDRKVVIGCASEQERQKVKEKLRCAPDLSVEDVKNKDPLLSFRHVQSYNDNGEVLRALKNQNKHILDSIEGEVRMEVAYRMKTRDPSTCHIVVRASPNVWKGFMNEGVAYIELQRVKVKDQSPLVQCSRCLGYGHTRRWCTEKGLCCSHCGGPHMRTECQQWLRGETAQCCNCTRAKLGNAEHSAFGDDCPVRKRWDMLARSAVQYC